jgi:hypothetical protein
LDPEDRTHLAVQEDVMLTASRITTRGLIAGAALIACTLLSPLGAPVSAETPSINPLTAIAPAPAAPTLLSSEAYWAATAAIARSAPAALTAEQAIDQITADDGTLHLDRRVVTAQQALQTGDLGSMQEEALLAVVSATTSWEETRDADAVTAKRVCAAQHALASADLGSMQEEALTAIVVEPMAPFERPRCEAIGGLRCY